MKFCSRCSETKENSCFGILSSSKDGLRNFCKKCRNEKSKEEYLKDPRKNSERTKKWKEDNREIVLEKSKKYYLKNRDKILSWQKENRERVNIAHRRWVLKNKDQEYKRIQECRKKRLAKDPILKMRMNVSRAIGFCLKAQNETKNSATWTRLPYTPRQLKDHLESLWEPWMTWENYGRPNSIVKKTWNIDHIVPQSKLLYDSMDHPNFLECWKLDNLRPLEYIENIKKGNK